ncbi:MAG: ABC transporter permease, partial [Chloroflexi bacterium]|nr:ABC transporter permease [Chloroflexota bacterium]
MAFGLTREKVASFSGAVTAALGTVRQRGARLWDTDSVRRLHSQKPAVVGEVLLLIVVLASLLAPFLAPYPIDKLDSEAMLLGPSLAHIFGTDHIGRDILSRVVYGGRISLQVGLIAVVVGLTGGVALGLISGYKGGTFIDQAISAVMDSWRAFPAILLALVLIAALGPDIENVMLAIGIVSIPSF